MQKIVRVREGEPIRELDEYTETWVVVKTLGPAEPRNGEHEWERFIYVLLERDEEASAEKLHRHNLYLKIVDRIAL